MSRRSLEDIFPNSSENLALVASSPKSKVLKSIIDEDLRDSAWSRIPLRIFSADSLSDRFISAKELLRLKPNPPK